MACRMGIVFLAAMVSLSANQSPPAPTILYATVGNSLRSWTLDITSGRIRASAGSVSLPAEIHYVAMHPGGKVLYASISDRAQVNAIHAFAVSEASGGLRPLGDPVHLPPELSRAVHITVDGTGRFLLMAHNTTETVGVVGLQTDGRPGQLVPQTDIPKLGFLAHQIRIDAANRSVFVPVRGNDAVGGNSELPGKLHVFSFDRGRLTLRDTVAYSGGIGPRHIDFHPTAPYVYVLTERGNLLLTHRLENGALKELFRTTTLRDPTFTFPAQRAGAIHVHPNGRWLYTTNRNVAPCASSVPCADRDKKPFDRGENNIAVFAIDHGTGRPTLIDNVDSHGFEPRTFTIDPSGSFLIVGNMMNIARKTPKGFEDVQPNLSVYRINANGRLDFLRSYEQAGSGLLWWAGAVRAVARQPE